MDGVDVLIRAVAVLRHRGVGVRLLLIGSGTSSYLRSLSELARELQVEKQIEHVKSVENRELPHLMEMASACVAPFRLRDTSATSIPNKVLEYLTTRRPVIAPSGSALERIFGPALVYFSPEDSESLSYAIVQALSAPPNQSAYSWQLRNAIQRRLNWKPIIEQEWRLITAAAAGSVHDAGIFDYAIGSDAYGKVTKA